MARPKKDPVRERLAADLTALIPSLDSEGLAFLLQQAHVHLHNMAVEAEEAARAAKTESLSSGKGKAAAGIASKKTNAAGKTGAQACDADWRIERNPSGSSFHLIRAGRWKLFSDTEMLTIVRIAQGSGKKDPLPERTERLVRWLAAERLDFFSDMEIPRDPHEPALRALTDFLARRFAVRS